MQNAECSAAPAPTVTPNGTKEQTEQTLYKPFLLFFSYSTFLVYYLFHLFQNSEKPYKHWAQRVEQTWNKLGTKLDFVPLDCRENVSDKTK